MLQVAVGDFVSRVGYPCTRGGFARTFEHILPCAFYRVVAVDERREAITVSVLVGKDYAEEEFWAGNFRVVTHRDCIAPLDRPALGIIEGIRDQINKEQWSNAELRSLDLVRECHHRFREKLREVPR